MDLPQINEDVRDLWDTELQFLYPGVDFAVGGEFSEFQDLLVDILRIFLIGVFLIYLILGAQFNSYSQPLLILLSVPFAFVGIILYLAVSGTPFSTRCSMPGSPLQVSRSMMPSCSSVSSMINAQRVWPYRQR